jgi:hypothetical protein
MPSPFPGMDPWLEHPAIFPDLHGSFIGELKKALNRVMPRRYFATIHQRVWVDLSLRVIEPDVNVLYSAAAPKKMSRPKPGRSSSKLAAQPLVIDAPGIMESEEMEEWYVDIFAKSAADDDLVTSVELLSLSNKRPGNRGREMYQRKQEEMIQSKVNLVEIDLLRGGTPTTLVPPNLVKEKFGPFDYHVCVLHVDQKDRFSVYPWKLESSLPVIDVPLIPGDPSVTIELQAILNECYDYGRYDMQARYRARKPKPRLTKQQTEWADKILKSHKL